MRIVSSKYTIRINKQLTVFNKEAPMLLKPKTLLHIIPKLISKLKTRLITTTDITIQVKNKQGHKQNSRIQYGTKTKVEQDRGEIVLHGNIITMCDGEFVMLYVNEFGNSFCECEKKL